MSYLTEEGLKKLKDELDRLVNVERSNISKQIAEARDKGDLSENAEYDAAKEAQGLLEMKINKLQEIVRNARVLDPSQINTDAVQILNKVSLKNIKTGSTMEYTIVSESEANLKEKKISVNTPIAKGLLGKKVGDIVEIQVPNGTVTFEILNISI
ncbi:MAG: transcription elongation factor GreA [Bacteroidales bacterium]|nr:transcription elongation factor GreA [Bacteroidales bacterium]MCK9497899.1 transcription elongation factor GreA [Bacteroidales bacterium]MDY0313899.1 transcription elongation factor GreA [Bacteroidales bacterium]NLB86846.1 transcription elongation factor GreA [Bacteroidales bacterium]